MRKLSVDYDIHTCWNAIEEYARQLFYVFNFTLIPKICADQMKIQRSFWREMGVSELVYVHYGH